MPLLALASVVALAAPSAPARAAAPAPAARKATTICQQRGWVAVTAAHGGHYLIKNDNYGGRAECISNLGLRSNFTVTRSAADSYGAEVMAYPFVLYGCSWGLCTAGSRLPALVGRIRAATASWSAAEHAGGQWNAAFDIWFGRHRSAIGGQAKGAELMIWLNARHFPAADAKVIRVDHRKWYVAHWVTRFGSAHWTYIQVRAVRPTSRVRRLALLPVIRRVEKMGLIRRQWWMLNIESGFEIWHGGRGLATRSFTASVRD